MRRTLARWSSTPRLPCSRARRRGTCGVPLRQAAVGEEPADRRRDQLTAQLRASSQPGAGAASRARQGRQRAPVRRADRLSDHRSRTAEVRRGFAGADPFPELAASWMASSPRLEHRYRARPSTVILSRAARPSVPLSSALPPAPEAPVAAPAQRSPSQMAAGDTILTSTPTRCKHYKPPRGRPVSRAPGGRARRPSGADLRASMIAVSRPAPQFTLARAPTCADRHGWA